ncbi:hypothetical protein CFAM422_010803 [Trichoderma lentiforme]|uniref:Uncharacterized protein n=1 Tax=Trichoderma lentiforme TaxID=1567552 RepID=A0A9P4X7W9_9HYPO|nr:hypothetical protein CFAM422_010803 [Trichoderma lentiforme]
MFSPSPNVFETPPLEGAEPIVRGAGKVKKTGKNGVAPFEGTEAVVGVIFVVLIVLVVPREV